MCACNEPPPRALLDGIAQFNRGRYFEQHETLEDLWRTERRPVRRLYQGILQVGVGLYHIQRRNHHGAVHMLTRGPVYLAAFVPVCQSIDVGRLLGDAARVRAEIDRLGPEHLNLFDWSIAPHVHLVAPPPSVSSNRDH